MSRKDEYRRYLASPEWRQRSEFTLYRSGGFCQFCGDFAVHAHHVTYPKRFGDEHPDNLVAVCARCHNLSHGVQTMKLSGPDRMSQLTPAGIKFNHLIEEGMVFASVASYFRALEMPQCMWPWFSRLLPQHAALHHGPGNVLMAEYEGQPVYRWKAVKQVLRSFDLHYRTQSFKDRPANDQIDIKRFHDRFLILVDWGDDVEEKAMYARSREGALVPGAPAPQGAEMMVQRLIDRFGEVMEKTVAPLLREHGEQIAVIKARAPAMRNPDEFISVKQAIIEMGYNAAHIPHPPSRENLAGVCGRRLAERGVKTGRVVCERLDASPIVVSVNTYARGAIYQALDELMMEEE